MISYTLLAISTIILMLGIPLFFGLYFKNKRFSLFLASILMAILNFGAVHLIYTGKVSGCVDTCGIEYYSLYPLIFGILFISSLVLMISSFFIKSK